MCWESLLGRQCSGGVFISISRDGEAHAESEGRSNSITLCVRYKSVGPMMNTDAMRGMMIVSHGQHFKDKKFRMTA